MSSALFLGFVLIRNPDIAVQFNPKGMPIQASNLAKAQWRALCISQAQGHQDGVGSSQLTSSNGVQRPVHIDHCPDQENI